MSHEMYIRATPMIHSNKYTVAAYLIESNGFHPMWNQWIASCITLKDFEGEEKAIKQTPDKTHEISVLAINPDSPIKPDIGDGDVIITLSPPDQVIQITAASDEEAKEKLDMAIELIKVAKLSPDSDYRSLWEQVIGGKTFKSESLTVKQTHPANETIQ